jgi:hypothetical protein
MIYFAVSLDFVAILPLTALTITAAVIIASY